MIALTQLADAPSLATLKVKLFADGADPESIVRFARNPLVAGFTTNPTLMRKAGVTDYEAFAVEMLTVVGQRPISFEVLADDFREMRRQALKIAGWGENVYVKIPVTDTNGNSTVEVVRDLTAEGVRLNVTALMHVGQVAEVTAALEGSTGAYISVFAGRIADTGRDPLPTMRESLRIMSGNANLQLIWASPRELLNIFQASDCGVHVITATQDVLAKLWLVGRDLDAYSVDTVRMFSDDARAAGFVL